MKTLKILLFIILAWALTANAQERQHSTYYYQRATLFEKLPVDINDIIFLGNSITDGAEWAELFNNPDVKNRGISGDVTMGVYDRLDAIRTGANTGKEDDLDLDKVNIDMDLYEGFVNGYLEETREVLTPAEIDTLAFGAKLLTYEQAVRFLDDYINNDKYYKTEYPDHNRLRANAQIKLLQSMEENWDQMQKIVEKA